jgi:hypothetical protein
MECSFKRLTAYLAKMFAPAPTPKPTTSVSLNNNKTH